MKPNYRAMKAHLVNDVMRRAYDTAQWRDSLAFLGNTAIPRAVVVRSVHPYNAASQLF